MNQNKKLHIRPIFNMDENQLRELIQILNFKEFHQFLIQLKKDKLNSGNFVSLLQKEYFEFIKLQRATITKDKITKISKKLKIMEVMV